MSDDSDCTVGVDEDSGGPLSPSILATSSGGHSDSLTSGNSQTSSGDPINSDDHVNASTTAELRSLINQQRSCLTIDQIIAEQEKVSRSLKETGTNSSVNLVENIVKLIEKSLREISQLNQTERERISMAYRDLANRDDLTQQESIAMKEQFREQLVGLSSRQKNLLACFNKQKEIAQTIQSIKSSDSSEKATAPRKGIAITTPMTNESGQQDVSISEGLIVASRPSMTVATEQSMISSAGDVDFSQPVGLESLINQGFMKPGKDCLSCILMGCVFKGSLLQDGSIQGTNGETFLLPQQWLNSCWANLGHTKKITRKQSYRNIFYGSEVLMKYCELYNMRQVTTYRQQSQHQSNTTAQEMAEPRPSEHNTNDNNDEGMEQDGPMATPTDVDSHILETQFSLSDILSNGVVVLHQPPTNAASLEVLETFWSNQCSFGDIPQELQDLINHELS